MTIKVIDLLVKIAKARIDYWTTQDKQVSIFDIEREVSRL